jgi:hypothetical protein
MYILDNSIASKATGSTLSKGRLLFPGSKLGKGNRMPIMS